MTHASGILTTWYKHVCTCLNHVRTCFRQCYCMYTAETCIYKSRNVYTCIYMVCTKVKNHKHVYTWYVHGMYNEGYKHVCTWFRHVCTCLYIYIQVLHHTNMYIQCTNMYIHVYAGNVQCTDGYIHFMNCTDSNVPCTYIVQLCTYTDISFRLQLFDSPGQPPVGWDWLLPGVTPIQVQAH